MAARADPSDAPVRSVGGAAALVIAVILVAASVYLLRGLLAPFLVAVFLLIVISGLSRLVRRAAPVLPPTVSMGIAVVSILATLAAALWITAETLAPLISDFEAYAQRINQVVFRLQVAAGIEFPRQLSTILRTVDASQAASAIANWLQIALQSTGFMLIYLGFMLASGRTFNRKLLAIAGARAGLYDARALFERIREAVGSYIWVQTATGLMIALLSWVLLFSLGVPSPLFWAFLIFLASYLPIVGGIVGAFPPTLFSLAVSTSLSTPLMVFVGLQLIQILIGNIIQPRMQGSRLNLDPLAVLLSIGIWGLLLGPVGAFLSTPLTVTAMAILVQFPNTRWIAILLSENSRPMESTSTGDTRAGAAASP